MDFTTAINILNLNSTEGNNTDIVTLTYQHAMRRAYTYDQQLLTKQALDCLIHGLYRYEIATRRNSELIPASVKQLANIMTNVPLTPPTAGIKLNLITKTFRPSLNRQNRVAQINAEFGIPLSHFCSLSVWYIADAPDNVRKEYISLLKICSGVGYPSYIHSSYLNIPSGDNLLLLRDSIQNINKLDWKQLQDKSLPLFTLNLIFAQKSAENIASYLAELIPNL